MKLLATGFDPFGPHAFNPSGALLRALERAPPGDSFETFAFQSLPTIFDTSRALLTDALDRERPDVVVLFGLAASTPAIRLERVALNLDDAALADNAGRRREGEEIFAGAPLARMTDFPLADLRNALIPMGFDVVVSNHAGAYVCNHVYYAALHHIAMSGSSCRALFVHLPEVAPDGVTHLARFAAALFREIRVHLQLA